MGDTRLLQLARRRHRDGLRAIVDELRSLREDAGLSQAAVARAAGLSPSFLSEVEGGRCRPALETLHAVATVLGCDLSLRLFPNGGPAIRDRFQARIVEGLLRVLDPRWAVRLEVPVRGSIRGVIDLVLDDEAAGLSVATEVHSDLRRVEQQVRWAHQKADALADALTEAIPNATPDSAATTVPDTRLRPRVSRLLVLRSTSRTRALVAGLSATFAADLPADPLAALRALTTPDTPWPGPALLWATVHGPTATVFARRVHPGPWPRAPVLTGSSTPPEVLAERASPTPSGTLTDRGGRAWPRADA